MSPGRAPADRSREEAALGLFPFTELSAAEYAARHGAGWLCFSFDEYTYRDPALDAWIQALGRVLRDGDLLEEARAKYLSPEEVERVRREAEEPS